MGAGGRQAMVVSDDHAKFLTIKLHHALACTEYVGMAYVCGSGGIAIREAWQRSALAGEPHAAGLAALLLLLLLHMPASPHQQSSHIRPGIRGHGAPRMPTHTW